MKENKSTEVEKKDALKKANKNKAKQQAKPDKNAKKPTTAVIKKKKEKSSTKKEPVKETNASELSADELAKIEKKKAKKLAQKLKKEERQKLKVEKQTESKAVKPNANPNKKSTDKDGKEQRRDPELEAATVFVGNLPVTTKRVQIAKLFAKFGGSKGIRLRTAAGQVLFKHKQRKQAGSLNAYVILNSKEAAAKALELNGSEFKGVHLRVTPSDSEKSHNEHDTKCTVFVGNLKYSANEEKLREIFSNCGEINYIRCIYDGKNKCKGVGYVCFKSPEAVGLALELNETLLDDRPIHVERYSGRKLGAKAARDKEASLKPKMSKKLAAQKRIDSKKGAKNNSNEPKDKKKSDYRGVKVPGIKKKNKKKVSDEVKSMAKKIAPKLKKKEAKSS